MNECGCVVPWYVGIPAMALWYLGDVMFSTAIFLDWCYTRWLSLFGPVEQRPQWAARAEQVKTGEIPANAHDILDRLIDGGGK